MRCEIDLVDHQQIRSCDAGAAFRGDFFAGSDINDVDRQIGEFRRKGRSEVVAAGFDEHEVERREFRPHVGDSGEIGRGILADGGVWATAGLDAGDPFGRECAGTHQIFGVPFGVDVVGDRRDLVSRHADACRAHPSTPSCLSRPGRRRRPARAHGTWWAYGHSPSNGEIRAGGRAGKALSAEALSTRVARGLHRHATAWPIRLGISSTIDVGRRRTP